MTGTTLGHYEIGDKLGEGGMGAVYRARDRRLGRDVAIKVLPTEFASAPDRLARFEREAQVLASLNHPNVATLYGFEDLGGCRFWSWSSSPGRRCETASLARPCR
jgi:serine/threonine protein kinase